MCFGVVVIRAVYPLATTRIGSFKPRNGGEKFVDVRGDVGSAFWEAWKTSIAVLKNTTTTIAVLLCTVVSTYVATEVFGCDKICRRCRHQPLLLLCYLFHYPINQSEAGEWGVSRSHLLTSMSNARLFTREGTMYGTTCKYRNDLRMRKPGKYWKERACIHLDEVLNYCYLQ